MEYLTKYLSDYDSTAGNKIHLLNIDTGKLSIAMVFILDGCSFQYEHILSKLGISIC